MTDIQASLGIHQLRRVNKTLSRRNEIWERYNNEFDELEVVTPTNPPSDVVHAHHLYTILVDEDFLGCNRNTFQERMQALADTVPNGNGRVLLLPGLGHVPHLEEPDTVVTPLVAYLQEGVGASQ